MSFRGNLKRLKIAVKKRTQGARKASNYVFKYEATHSLLPIDFIELKDDLGSRFIDWGDSETVIKNLAEEIKNSARCYATTDNVGFVQSYLLVKEGCALQKWFIDIMPKDAIIYSVVTHPSTRGKRLAGRLSACVADIYRNEGNSVYLDCACWNTSAHRAFLNAGFKKINESSYPPLK